MQRMTDPCGASSAIFMAAANVPPAETPTKIPSFRASSLLHRIASGGLSSVKDVETICARLVPEGVIGAIAGRALYEGKLDLKVAQAAADKALGKA